jgi:hypothetical protein
LVPYELIAIPPEPGRDDKSSLCDKAQWTEGHIMGRYLLLWLLGIPLPILLLIWVFGGLH